MVEETVRGRIWATPGTTAIKDLIPSDVICSGANSSRVFADGVLRIAAKGGIANDAGIGKNDSAVEGVRMLGERGVPAAAVGTLSARLGEGLSTWHDGVISVVNPVAAARGVEVGMTAQAGRSADVVVSEARMEATRILRVRGLKLAFERCADKSRYGVEPCFDRTCG